jgi:hypothetical protein
MPTVFLPRPLPPNAIFQKPMSPIGCSTDFTYSLAMYDSKRLSAALLFALTLTKCIVVASTPAPRITMLLAAMRNMQSSSSNGCDLHVPGQAHQLTRIYLSIMGPIPCPVQEGLYKATYTLGVAEYISARGPIHYAAASNSSSGNGLAERVVTVTNTRRGRL